jgi:LEA14-like dessication related protein
MNRKQIYYIISIAVFFILVLSFAGFTYYADAEAVSKTQIKIQNLNLIKIHSNGVKLGFTVNFVNPSDREINDLSSDFDIYIDGIKIGSGSFSDIDIKPYDYTSKQMTVMVSYSGLAQSAVNVIKNFIYVQKTGFTIKGTIKVDTLFGLTEISQKFIAAN